MCRKRKNKDIEEKRGYNYTDWNEDFGFLNLILSRKKNSVREFVIKVMATMRKEGDYIDDADIEPIIFQCVKDVLASIGDNYKNFLIEKYFGTETAFITFITEDIYISLLSDSITSNNSKIKAFITKQAIEKTAKLNNKETRK